MKVLFLDIDGVLLDTFVRNKMFYDYNVQVDRNRINADIEAAENFNPRSVKVLHDLLNENPDLSIVISSTWRYTGDLKLRSLDTLKTIFAPYWFKDRIIDVTPTSDNRDERAVEILKWLSDHVVDNYLILDDTELGSAQEQVQDHFVMVDYKLQLTEEDGDKARIILNPPYY